MEDDIMRMKKQARVGIVAAMMLLLTAWGSLAYYVANETAHNVISTGGLDIELVESAINESGRIIPFQNLNNLLPGETVSKIPQVRNLGKYSAYIRAKVQSVATLADGTKVDVPASLVGVNYDQANWKHDEDGYFYYNEALKEAELSKELFDTVTIAPELGNIYKDATFAITVSVEAVQAVNNGASAITATGWPEE